MNIVFFCAISNRDATICSPDEVSNLFWYTVDEAIKDQRVMPWTLLSLKRANTLYTEAEEARTTLNLKNPGTRGILSVGSGATVPVEKSHSTQFNRRN